MSVSTTGHGNVVNHFCLAFLLFVALLVPLFFFLLFCFSACFCLGCLFSVPFWVVLCFGLVWFVPFDVDSDVDEVPPGHSSPGSSLPQGAGEYGVGYGVTLLKQRNGGKGGGGVLNTFRCSFTASDDLRDFMKKKGTVECKENITCE